MPERGHQKLEVEAVATGFDKAAKDHDKVGDAQQRLQEGAKKTTKATEAAGDAQKKLSASESDWIEILRSVNPAFGALADTLVKGSRVAGDMASRNIDLTATFKSLTGAVKNNAGALALIGAGGAVVLAISAISRAVAAMRQEFEEATQAVRDQINALNELEKGRAERIEELERLSVKLYEGPYSDEQASRAGEVAERLESRGAKPGAARRAVLLAGADASVQLLERLAILLDQYPEDIEYEKLARAPLEVRQSRIETLLQRRQQDLDTIVTREAQQRAKMAAKAEQQARTPGGPTLDIAGIIRTMPGRGFEGLDPERIARVVKGLQATEGREVSLWDIPRLIGGAIADVLIRGQSGVYSDLEAKRLLLREEGVEATPAEIRSAEFVIQQMSKVGDQLERAAGSLEHAANVLETAEPNVNFDNRGAWQTFADPAAQRKAMTHSSESIIERAER